MGVAWGLRGDPQSLSPLAVDAGAGLPGIRLDEATGNRVLILPLGRRWGGWEAGMEDESCVLPGRNWRIQGEDAAPGDTATLSLLGFLSVSARLADFYHLCL